MGVLIGWVRHSPRQLWVCISICMFIYMFLLDSLCSICAPCLIVFLSLLLYDYRLRS